MKKNDELRLEENRWQAVVRREKDGEDRFVYAVKTTGVFCSPGCASRMPDRGNVEFFDSCRQAEQAGYRPCLRCRPNAMGREAQLERMMISACRRMEQAERPLTLTELAGKAGLSPGHFQRLFTRIIGVSPKRYMALKQAQRFQRQLKTQPSVTEAIYAAGYSSSSRAHEHSRDRLAMSPSAYRHGGLGETIHYAVGECSLGQVLVGVTGRGVCAVEFLDRPTAFPQQLKDSFPNARLEPAGAEFAALMKKVIACIERPEQGWQLPLDIRGSAFQERVWAALRGLAPGTTASYGQIAQSIGQPLAARAVARACGANPVAVAIPCHRVVRHDGTVGGYKWGAERKKQLLARERATPPEKASGQDVG